VSPCSHTGGHNYAGNLIIYGPNADGEVIGHWYGYVTLDDVPILLDQHFYRSICVPSPDKDTAKELKSIIDFLQSSS